MLIIPFQVSQTEYNVFVALDDVNIERMKAYDPAQVQPAKMGMPWVSLRLGVILIGYANPSDVEEIQRLIARGKPGEITKFLSRGFAFKPEAGDHDNAYERQQ